MENLNIMVSEPWSKFESLVALEEGGEVIVKIISLAIN